MKRRIILVLVGLMLIVIMLALYSCEKAPETKPSPVSNLPSGAASVEPASVAPPAKPDISKALPIGMKPGERYHDIHTSKVNLKCETCHVKQAETYFDPMAQASNPVDKRACLSCHTEGSVQPFYGANWDKSSVKK